VVNALAAAQGFAAARDLSDGEAADMAYVWLVDADDVRREDVEALAKWVANRDYEGEATALYRARRALVEFEERQAANLAVIADLRGQLEAAQAKLRELIGTTNPECSK
jgi:Flp pilus assembly protein TadD